MREVLGGFFWSMVKIYKTPYCVIVHSLRFEGRPQLMKRSSLLHQQDGILITAGCSIFIIAGC